MAYDAGAVLGHLRMDMSGWTSNVSRAKADTLALTSGMRGIQSSVNRMTGDILRGSTGLGNFAAQLRSSAGAMRMLIGAVGAFSIAKLGKSFLQAAADAEKARTVFSRTLGSIEEGNKLFGVMAKYASTTVLTFEDTMHAAVSLSAVLKNGREQVQQWIPLWGDLAAYVNNLGVSAQETTSQLLRMLSGGAAAADLFREKGGILMTLGFEPNRPYTLAETAKILVEGWMKADSAFRGMAEKMASTWIGQVSMMEDKWFLFRLAIMDKGPFEALKKGIKGVNAFWDSHFEQIVGLTVKYGGIALKIGGIAAALVGLRIAGALGAFALGSILGPLDMLIFRFPVLLAHIATTQISFAALAGAGIASFAGIIGMAVLLLAAVVGIAAAVTSLLGTFNNESDRANIQKLWNDIKFSIDEATNSVVKFAEKFQSVIDWATGKKTPLTWLDSKVADLLGVSQDSWTRKIPTPTGLVGGAVTGGASAISNWANQDKPISDWFGGNGQQPYDSKMDIWSGGLENVKTQLQGLVKFATDIVSGLTKDAATAGQKAAEDIPANLEKMLKGIGGTTDKAGAAAAKKAASELEKLIDAGRATYLALNPVEGTIAKLQDSLLGLQAAGLLTDDTRSLLGADVWDQIKELGPAAIQAIIDKLKQAGGDAAIVGQKLQDVARAAASVKAEEILTAAQPDLMAFQKITADLEALKVAGRMDNENLNIMSGQYWREFGGVADAELQRLIDRLDAVGGAAAQVGEELRTNMALEGVEQKADPELTKINKKIKAWEDLRGMVGSLAGELSTLGSNMGSTALQAIGQVISAVITMIITYYMMAAAAVAAGTAAAIAWMHILGPIYLVVAAINIIIGLFTVFGKKAKEEITATQKLMQGLEEVMNSAIDSFADKWVEFLETGKFNFKEFVDSILKDLARMTAKLAMQEVISGLFGVSFSAKGNVFKAGNIVPFARGGVVSRPTMFPMPANKRGMMGEAGPEAVFPLRRNRAGELGVAGTSPGVVVNIIDQRRSGEQVQVQETRGKDGTRQLQVFIRDTLEGIAAEGGLDRVMKYALGRVSA